MKIYNINQDIRGEQNKKRTKYSITNGVGLFITLMIIIINLKANTYIYLIININNTKNLILLIDILYGSYLIL